MENKDHEFVLDADDTRLYAQFTQYMKTVLGRARRDYLEKETNYKRTFLAYELPLDEQYDIEDATATDELERLVNWEMIKSYLRCLTLKEAEVLTGIFVNRLTQAECALRMGVSQPYVATLYKAALQKLRKAMMEDGEYGGL